MEVSLEKGKRPNNHTRQTSPIGIDREKSSALRGFRSLRDKASGFFSEVGSMFIMGFQSIGLGLRNGFPVGEFVNQSWFLVRVSTLACIIISIPFGMIIALEIGSLLQQVGAQTQLGAVMVLATVREQAPLATLLVISGAGGAAITADLGSRVIRDEISAMEVMGISPLRGLVLPRLAAMTLLAVCFDGVVSIAGILGGLYFGEHSLHISTSSFFATFSDLSQLADLFISLFKSAVFGFLAAMVACYKGLNVKSGATGVGDAVNQGVVISFVLAFAVNFILTVFYFNFVVQKAI